jgi:hypothetical protein
MDVFIYFKEQLSLGLDEIEDALDFELGEFGEVTGTGIGELSSNIDIELYKEAEVEDVLTIIREILSNFNLPKSTIILINDKEYKLKDMTG